MTSEEPWLIEFYAPWYALLPDARLLNVAVPAAWCFSCFLQMSIKLAPACCIYWDAAEYEPAATQHHQAAWQT